MRKGQRGLAATEFALAMAFVFTFGLAGLQFGDMALTAVKVNHAAQEAASVVAGAPAAERDAAAYQAVMENLGAAGPNHTSVTLTQLEQSPLESFRVTVTYQEPITSPLLRLLMGPTFTAISEAGA